MSLSDLTNFIFDKENKGLQCWLGFLLVGLPLVFLLGGGFGKPINANDLIFSSSWFREIFIVIIGIMIPTGIILLIAGFGKTKNK